MQCPNCHSLLDDETVFCGNCGRQVAPVQATGATIASSEDASRGGADAPTLLRHNPSWAMKQGDDAATQLSLGSPSPIPPVYTPPIQSATPVSSPQAPQQAPPRRSNTRRIALIGALLVIVVGGGIALTLALLQRNGAAGNPGANASGQVLFFDGANGSGNTDALKITINGLGAPPSGSHYDAWLVNVAAEQATALGSLTQNGSVYSVSFGGNGGNGQAGTNLVGAGNQVEITLEQGNPQLPTGKIILIGTFPPKAFVHIRHLLFSFPTTPGKIGLLVGLQQQTKLLNAQALLLQSIAANHNAAATQCAAQSIIDIAEGQQGANFKPLAASCGSSTTTGDGFGILGTNGYASTTAAHASLAATQSDSTNLIRQHASEIEVGMSNITGWVTTIDQDALKLLNNPNNTATVQEIATLSDHAFHGVDVNGNGQIDPVSGEEGAVTAYLRGQLMATLPLVPSNS